MIAVLIPGLLGLLLWRWAVSGRTQPLAPSSTGGHGLGLFLAGMLVVQVLPVVLMPFVNADPDELTLSGQLAVQAACNLAGIGLVLGLAARLTGGLPALGLRRHRGAPAWITALSPWLAAVPLLAAAKWANTAVIELVGGQPKTQDHMLHFLEQGSVDPLWVWTAMVLILPVCEEILFRGALFGELRRRMPAASAMLVSGLLFGMLHDTSVVLPVAVLGALLAWLYERTGSLTVPCLVHILQNGVTLTLITLFPEEML